MGNRLPVDEEKMNNQYKKLMADNARSAGVPSPPLKEQPRTCHPSDPTPSKLMKVVRSWTTLLEAMNELSDGIDDVMNDDMSNPIGSEPEPSGEGDQQELIDQLNKLFTPVLIMQGFENDSADKMNESMSEAGVLSEKSIIKFDDDTRMAQLIAVCARLIHRQKNSQQWQMYAKAHKIKNAMDMEMQKSEYNAAKALANAYLLNVSTTNNSPVAREAAKSLMPATQH